jgi:hypothetical protein
MGINSDALYHNLLSDLSYVSGFDPNYDTWPGITPKQFAAQALAASFYKKFVENKASDADDKAVEKFLSVNMTCGNYELYLDNSKDEVLVGELKQSIYNFWNPRGFPLVSNHYQILDNGRCGPGASVGSLGKDFYTKLFASKLTSTSEGLYEMYSDYLSWRPEWQTAELYRQRAYGTPHIVKGSKLHLVDKSNDISRLICSEPSLNMFFQLGFGQILTDRLKSFFGIDLSTQPDKNRELARRGSITDQYSTIDLSSASDSISLKMVDAILPRDFVAWLKLLRSPTTEIRGERVALNMMSTMGNGYTFPLQTMLFACVVSAAARFHGFKLMRPRGDDLGNFAVFGDDIICDRKIVDSVIRLLTLLGFEVNQQKSFVEGPFKESCGRDYYHGHNVRGAYLKKLSTQQDLFVAINNLNLWTAKTGIPLGRTVRYLSSRCRNTQVPPIANLDAGIRMPFEMVNLTAENRDRDTGSVRYKSWIPIARQIRITDSGFKLPRGEKERIYNPSGLFLAFLQGYIRNSTISIRHDKVKYCTRWVVTPSWDYLPLGSDILSESSWLRWKSAVYLNLFR